jgi:hypothetical protein
MKMVKQCFECRAGEHDNEDEDVRMCVIKSPLSDERTRRGYLCATHRMVMEEDGYKVTLV